MSDNIEVFISYVHEDEALCKRLETHLAPLKKQGVITVWHNRNINAGTEWKRELDTHLNTAQIILLLISADFLASESSSCIEMKRAIEMHEAGIARVIPIILRHTLWEEAFLGKLQALPKKGNSIEPVTSSHWRNMDEAFLNIVEGIRVIIEELTGRQIQATPYQPIPTRFRPVVPAGFPRARTLVGRDADLMKLMEQLRAGEASNICALHGMGGVGKTSLAAEVVAGLSQDRNAFPGGAAWISCEGVTGPDGLNTIWKRIASDLRLEQIMTGVQGEEIRVLLASELARFPRLLLVLDNVEPQLDVDILLNTLAVPSHTVLLLTSRQTLAPERLTVLQLRPLADDAAVILFTQRMEQADSSRSLQDEMKEIVTIVTALGGLPLAIELVAAYAGIQRLPLSQILLELEQDKVEATSLNFDSRNALLSRFHRSWMALTRQEQRLFAGLSLLKGITFPRTAALALTEVTAEENSIRLEHMPLGLGHSSHRVDPHAQQDLSKLVAYALVEPLPNQQLRLHPLLGEYALLCFNQLQFAIRENLKKACAIFWSNSTASYEGLSGLEAYRLWQIAREFDEEMMQLKAAASFSQRYVALGLDIDSLLDFLRIGLYVARHGEPDLGRQLIERSLAGSTQYIGRFEVDSSAFEQLEEVKADCLVELARIDNDEKNYENAAKHYGEAKNLYQKLLRLNEQKLENYKNRHKFTKEEQRTRSLEVEIRLVEERISAIQRKLQKIPKHGAESILSDELVSRTHATLLYLGKGDYDIRDEESSAERSYSLPDDRPFRIGRQRDVDLFLVDTSASRVHATIYAKLDVSENKVCYYLIDNDSRNGTQLNAALINHHQSYPLYSGDTIHIGTTILRFIQ